MVKLRAIFILLFAIFILYPALLYSQEEGAARRKLPVEIDADSIRFDRESNLYVAEGNVVAMQSGVTLKADTIILDMEQGRLTARGNLKGIDEGGNELSGTSIELDLDLKSAVLLNGRLFFKDNNVHIISDEIRKVGPQTYEAGRTTYTACDCEADDKPTWSITTRETKVIIGEYLTGWHTLFRVKDVPVFYIPYIKVPVKRDRQSGFLMPTPGYSDVRGATLSNYLFWAIDDSSDATFTLDADTKRGYGGAFQFRYFSPRLSYSELNFRYYRERDIDRVRAFRENVQNLSRPLSAGVDRWELKFSHDETLPLAFKFRADIHIVSDDEYFIDFEEDQEKRSVASLESSISLTRKWRNYILVAEFRRFDNLLSEDDTNVLQKIPEATFTALPRRVSSTPLFFSMDMSAVNYIRKSGEEGQRIDIAPRLSLPLRPWSYLELLPSLTPRYTKYRVRSAAGTTYPDRFIYEFRTDLVTTFVRDFSAPASRPGAGPRRHTIRPRLTYRYVPDVDQLSLPDFDDLDMMDGANELEYSLNSTLSHTYREGKKLKRFEYLYLLVSQAYDIKESQRGLTGPGDERRSFTDIKAELRLNPTSLVSLNARGAYDLYESRFNRYDSSVKLSDRRGDNLYISYRFDRELQTRYMEGSARLRLHRTLDLLFKRRYSFDEERTLETVGAAEFRQQCWSAKLTYRKTPEENLVLLNISLESLGDFLALSETR